MLEQALAAAPITKVPENGSVDGGSTSAGAVQIEGSKVTFPLPPSVDPAP